MRHEWGLFSIGVENALDSMTEERPWYRTVFSMAAAPKIDVLSIDLVQYEISVEQEVRRIQAGTETLIIERGLDRFRESLDNEIDNLLKAPTEKYRRILRVIQDHNKEITGFRVVLIAASIGIVAALLGGVAGGFITLLSTN